MTVAGMGTEIMEFLKSLQSEDLVRIQIPEKKSIFQVLYKIILFIII